MQRLGVSGLCATRTAVHRVRDEALCGPVLRSGRGPRIRRARRGDGARPGDADRGDPAIDLQGFQLCRDRIGYRWIHPVGSGRSQHVGLDQVGHELHVFVGVTQDLPDVRKLLYKYRRRKYWDIVNWWSNSAKKTGGKLGLNYSSGGYRILCGCSLVGNRYTIWW